MKTYGVTEEQLAMVAVVQREWAAKSPRASYRDPITVDDVLGSTMIAYPFRKLMCCLVTDARPHAVKGVEAHLEQLVAAVEGHLEPGVRVDDRVHLGLDAVLRVGGVQGCDDLAPARAAGDEEIVLGHGRAWFRIRLLFARDRAGERHCATQRDGGGARSRPAAPWLPDGDPELSIVWRHVDRPFAVETTALTPFNPSRTSSRPRRTISGRTARAGGAVSRVAR
jgi:hypothetical protein